MGFYVYILLCSDGSYYTGHTDNLESRLAAHHTGQIAGYTLTRRPVRLAFAEEFASREEALASERQIKGWSRAKKEALIKRDWERLIELSHTSSIPTVQTVHGSTGSPRTDYQDTDRSS